MTVPQGPDAVLDTAFFRRWLDHATAVISQEAGYLTDLDSAIGDADHGANLKRGFTSASAFVATERPATPGELLRAFGTHLTNTVGGASGPLYGTVLRRAGRTLGDQDPVRPESLGEALEASVAGVRRLGDSSPGDKTMVDALAPAAEAYSAALEGGAGVAEALAAAAQAARDGAESTIPMQARRGRASYLGERSIGHKDPGATSSALLLTALYEALDPALSQASDPQDEDPQDEARGAAEQGSADPASGQPGSQSAAPSSSPSPKSPSPQSPPRQGPGAESEPRVGVVLVSHSHEVATASADLALALVGSGTPAPVATAGGVEGGGIGTSATLIRKAIKHVDAGHGVVVLCDMGSAVLTVKALLAETGEGALPDTVRIADAPFLEGAVAALVTASAGADLDLVLSATDDARSYRKL